MEHKARLLATGGLSLHTALTADSACRSQAMSTPTVDSYVKLLSNADCRAIISQLVKYCDYPAAAY